MNAASKSKPQPHPATRLHQIAAYAALRRAESARQARNFPRATLALLALCASAWLSFSAFAGPSNDTASASTTNPSATGAAGSNVKTETSPGVTPPFVEPPVPEARFVMPKGPAEGKDPFFPRSTAVYDGYAPKPTTKGGPAPVVAELVLRGISGSDEKPLAIINTTTFGTGDELDVTTKAGKLRLRCLEIDKAAGTVSVQLGSEHRILRLPPPAPLPTPK